MHPIELLYGKGKLSISLPNAISPTIIRKPAMPVIAEPAQAVEQSLANPTGTEPLEVLCQKAATACIVICDITRPVPNHLFLRPLIEKLMSCGIPKENITLLVATGLHRPNLGEELAELVGDSWVVNNIRVINHDARNDEDHVDLGQTRSRGTPVKLNRHLVEADIRIVSGLVEPHFMAGYSGGRKVIAPGVAHAETITTFHNHSFMSNPSAENCNLHGNPLHEEQLQIVEMLGDVLAINTVIDEDRQLSLINFGEVVASHRNAVQFIERYCQVKVDQEFDVVITSAAGYPLDKTYYQTVKGMVGAMGILKSGGELIIASECSEGLGSPEYQDAQSRLTQLGTSEFLESLSRKAFADIDEWQTQMQTKAMAVGNIRLYSNLDPKFDDLLGIERIHNLDEYLQNIATDKTVAVIPEGPYVIPTCS